MQIGCCLYYAQNANINIKGLLGRTDTLCLILVQIGSICVDLDLQFYRGKMFCYSFCIVKRYKEHEIQREKKETWCYDFIYIQSTDVLGHLQRHMMATCLLLLLCIDNAPFDNDSCTATDTRHT